MPFQPVPNTVLIRLIGDLSGELAINDMAFTKDPGPLVGLDVVDITAAIGDWWSTAVVPLLDDRYFFEQAVGVDQTAPASFKHTAGYAVSGGVSGGGAPNNVSFCVSFKSGLAGRSGNGRNFLPGIPLQYLSGNLVNEEPLANLLAAYNPLVAGGEGVLPADWKWVVISRQAAGVKRPVGIPFGVVSAVATDNIVDSQRRRLPGRGR